MSAKPLSIKRQRLIHQIVGAKQFFKLVQSGGPMRHVNSSSGGAVRSRLLRAYWTERVIPSFGSVSVPSRSNRLRSSWPMLSLHEYSPNTGVLVTRTAVQPGYSQL